MTRIRWPHGTTGPSFFEKNLPSGAPAWLRSVTVPSSGSRAGDSSRDTITYPLVDDTAALTYLANLASLELHVPQWRVDADGRAAAAGPAGHRPGPGQPGRAARVRPAGAGGEGAAGGAGPDQRAGHQRQQGHAAVRRAARRPGRRGDPRRRAGDRPGPDPRPARARGVEDDQVAAPGQGPAGLEPEHRRQDDHRAVLAARQGRPLRRGTADLGGGRARRRATGAAGAPADGRGAAPGEPRRRPVRAGAAPAEGPGLCPGARGRRTA